MLRLVAFVLVVVAAERLQAPAVSTDELLTRLRAACPHAEDLALDEPDVTTFELHDTASPDASATWPPDLAPWPVVMWSPDSSAHVEFSFIDSPKQAFVRSRRHSIGNGHWRYLTGRHLLDAAWLDNDRFLLITSASGPPWNPTLALSIDDFATRKRFTWIPTYSGAVPDSSWLAREISRRQAEAGR